MAKGIVGSSHSRECDERVLRTRGTRPVELDSWSYREYNQQVGTPSTREYKQRVVGREGYYRETSGYGYSLIKTLP